MSRAIERRVNVMGLGLGVLLAFYLFYAASHAPAAPPSRFQVTEIDADAARKLLEAGAVFIDVRGREAYGDAHIPGALPIPLADLRGAIPTSPTIDRTQPIVVYCGDGVTTAQEGAAIVAEAGFTGAVSLRGGLASWQKAGLPLEAQPG